MEALLRRNNRLGNPKNILELIDKWNEWEASGDPKFLEARDLISQRMLTLGKSDSIDKINFPFANKVSPQLNATLGRLFSYVGTQINSNKQGFNNLVQGILNKNGMQAEKGAETLTVLWGKYAATVAISKLIIDQFMGSDEEDNEKLKEVNERSAYEMANSLAFNPIQMQLYSSIKLLTDTGVVGSGVAKL